MDNRITQVWEELCDFTVFRNSIDLGGIIYPIKVLQRLWISLFKVMLKMVNLLLTRLLPSL